MSCNLEHKRTVPDPVHTNGTFQLFNDRQSNTTLNNYVSEGLNIGGCPINVFKLQGIYSQKSLNELNGNVISSGEYPEFPASNITKNDCSEWHSTKYCGKRNLNTYIGFDFGPIELDPAINKYAIDTEKKYHITSIFIQQGDEFRNRITKARVEASDNGLEWKGISLFSLPDDNQEHLIDIKQSHPARYWRVVPISYNTEDDIWVVKKLSFSEYTKTDIQNIQDFILLENRDRSYQTSPIIVKAYYDNQEVQTEFSMFGMQLNNQFTFKFGFNLTIQNLKRPIIIGDILEVVPETQYDINLNPVKKYLEVTDVSWTAGGFTPGWEPTLYTVIAQPMLASQETMDIVGDLNNDFFDSISDGFNTTALKADKNIRAESNTVVPEAGGSLNDIQIIPESIIQNGVKHGVNYNKLNPSSYDYLQEDAMPPNGLPYTEGDKYPENPKNKDYHRLTYSMLDEPVAPRLYQYSEKKKRWIYLETDRRFESNFKKPQQIEFDNGANPAEL
jgi:hypothetical protein